MVSRALMFSIPSFSRIWLEAGGLVQYVLERMIWLTSNAWIRFSFHGGKGAEVNKRGWGVEAVFRDFGGIT